MKLTEQQLSELAAELDQVKANVMNQLGDKEARYIRRMLLTQRLSAISGRILMVLGFVTPWLWVFGVALLALAKILDNMEIGHNVLHGQYDWMNDPVLHSSALNGISPVMLAPGNAPIILSITLTPISSEKTAILAMAYYA